MRTDTLLERAKVNHNRADKCRDLISVISDRHAIAILEEYACELDARARVLEFQARELSLAKP
jgi:hypothetical protein